MKNDMKTALERRIEISNLVGKNGKMHVDELVDEFNVTGATIRADLRFLEQNGYIVRSHGYALVNKTVFSNLKSTYSETAKLDFVGSAISKMIEPNDTIFIHSNKFIRTALDAIKDFKNTTIVSNDLRLVNKFINVESCKFFMTGGQVKSDMKLNGAQTINSLKQYRFNKAFVFVDGFDSKLGLFAKNENDSELIRALLEISGKVIVVVSSSVFESNSPFWVCENNSIDVVISEGEISPTAIDTMEFNNVKVIN